MTQTSAANAPALVRDQFLTLTSGFRIALEQSEEQLGGTPPFDMLGGAARALRAAADSAGLSSLAQCGRGLDRMTTVAAAMAPVRPPHTRAILEGMHDALGAIEQLLFWSIDGTDPQQQQRLWTAFRQSFPVRCHPLLEGSDSIFTELLQNLVRGATRTDAPNVRGPQPGTSPEPSDPRELLGAFAIEATDIFQECEEVLVRLEQEPTDDSLLATLMRHFHTLKGAANAVGLTVAGDQLHEGESLLEAVRTRRVTATPSALTDFLLRLTDSVKGVVDQTLGYDVPPGRIIADVSDEVTLLIAASAAGAADDSTPRAIPSPPPPPAPRVAATTRPAPQAVIKPPPSARPPEAPAVAADAPDRDHRVVKVDSSHLDALIENVDELRARRTDLDQQMQALVQLRQQLDSGSIGKQFRRFIDGLDRQARQFLKIASGLEERVINLRRSPVDEVFRRLQRPVRDAARQEGKLVDLQFSGSDISVDRGAVEALYPALLHVLRNAVAHGVESPEERERTGKTPTGTVRVSATLIDEHVMIAVEDDGRGLDFAAIRAKAEANGWLDRGQPASNDTLAHYIFRSGFSTRAETTELAGRGVGMDVVRREIEALGGRVEIDSLERRGTTIRLWIPDRGDTERLAEAVAAAQEPEPSRTSGKVRARIDQ